MAYSYMFFKPKVLPLRAQDLSQDTVDDLDDPIEVRSCLAKVFPQLVWGSDGWAKGETEDGRWFEFSIAKGGTLFLRCSLRASYVAEVQLMCDSLGWIAVDQVPKVIEPRTSPKA